MEDNQQLRVLPPLLVTLAFEEEAFRHFNALRKQYFPPERNFLPAHITLFHQLPGNEQKQIEEILKKCASSQGAFMMETAGLWMLGRGVAYLIASQDAQNMRNHLAETFQAWLTPQDKTRHFKPHITVQNKVRPDDAKTLYHLLNQTFIPYRFKASGLELWRYMGGPWEFIARYNFIQN